MLLDLASEEQVEELIRATELHVRLDRHRVIGLAERIEDLVRADGGSLLHSVGEILTLQHLLKRRLGHETEDVGGGHHCKPFGVVAHLEMLSVEDQIHLLEIGLRVRGHLFGAEHGPCLGSSAGVADHRRVVADDQHHRMSLILKQAQRVEHHEMTDMEVGGRGIEAKLHAQLVAALEARAKVVLDMDLNRPLPQAIEKRARHDAAMG